MTNTTYLKLEKIAAGTKRPWEQKESKDAPMGEQPVSKNLLLNKEFLTAEQEYYDFLKKQNLLNTNTVLTENELRNNDPAGVLFPMQWRDPRLVWDRNGQFSIYNDTPNVVKNAINKTLSSTRYNWSWNIQRPYLLRMLTATGRMNGGVVGGPRLLQIRDTISNIPFDDRQEIIKYLYNNPNHTEGENLFNKNFTKDDKLTLRKVQEKVKDEINNNAEQKLWTKIQNILWLSNNQKNNTNPQLLNTNQQEIAHV